MAVIGTGSKTSLHHTPETVYGVTPATPVFTPLCVTSMDIMLAKDTLEDDCLTPDRKIKGFRHGSENVTFSAPFNLAYGNYDSIIEAVLMGTWATNVVGIGTTDRSFTTEQFIDLDVDEYHRHEGVVYSSLSIEAKPNDLVRCTVDGIGRRLDSSSLTSQVAGATYTAQSENEAFDAYNGSVNVNGSPMAIGTGLSIKIDNGFEPAGVLFSKNTIQPTSKKCRVTATLDYYYTDKALFELFINETMFNVDFTFTDVDGNSLKIDLIDCKFGSGGPTIGGDGPIQPSQEIVAEDITFTRIPA